jgi:hypothetical protein
MVMIFVRRFELTHHIIDRSADDLDVPESVGAQPHLRPAPGDCRCAQKIPSSTPPRGFELNTAFISSPLPSAVWWQPESPISFADYVKFVEHMEGMEGMEDHLRVLA